MLDEKAKEFFRKKGRKGGKTTSAKYGKIHYIKAANKRWNKEKLSTDKSLTPLHKKAE